MYQYDCDARPSTIMVLQRLIQSRMSVAFPLMILSDFVPRGSLLAPLKRHNSLTITRCQRLRGEPLKRRWTISKANEYSWPLKRWRSRAHSMPCATQEFFSLPRLGASITNSMSAIVRAFPIRPIGRSIYLRRIGSRALIALVRSCCPWRPLCFLPRYLLTAAGSIWPRTASKPASATSVKQTPAMNVPFGPVASHRAPAMMLAASMATPVSRLKKP